jgi:hypothetical protein
MSSEPSDPLYAQIYNKLQEKETEELLEIWQQNNRDEWSDNAFTAIHEILLERLGSEPPQQEALPEDEKGKYLFFDLDKVVSLSDNINTVAWFVLGGYIIVWIGNLFSGGITAQTVIALLYVLIQGFVFFLILRFLAQALNLLLEIVENTRN